MGHCGSSIKEVWLEDERNSSGTYDSEIAQNPSGDSVRSCESVCMSTKFVDSPAASVNDVSEHAIGESREEKKESGDLLEITVSEPLPKNYAKPGGWPQLSFDKNRLSFTFKAGYTAKTEAAQQTSKKSIPGTTIKDRCSQFASNKLQTSISDWGDLYNGSTFINKHDSSQFTSLLSGTFSDMVASGESSSPSYEVKNLTIQPGHVLGMLWANKGFQFEILNLNWSMKEVVDLFLVKKCGARLPVSFSRNKLYLPTVMSNERMKTTIAENLGSQFDVKTQGLLFATGSVNSKFCYKITECERSEMEKMYSIFRSNRILKRSS